MLPDVVGEFAAGVVLGTRFGQYRRYNSYTVGPWIRSFRRNGELCSEGRGRAIGSVCAASPGPVTVADMVYRVT